MFFAAASLADALNTVCVSAGTLSTQTQVLISQEGRWNDSVGSVLTRYESLSRGGLLEAESAIRVMEMSKVMG